MHEPPYCSQERDARQDDTVVVHGSSGDGERVREAENDVEENDADDCNGVDRISRLAHPERSLWEVLAAGKQMASNS